jgi:uncharacterized protein
MIILKEKNVLITGAAHGIGASFANILAEEGCHLCLIDIDEKKLKETANTVREKGDDPLLIVKDLSIPEERELTFLLMSERGFSIDILINNVAIGYWCIFNESPWEEIEKIIDVNIKCLTHMAKLALPGMLSKNEGYIVNLSSTAAFVGVPNAACYSATKAYADRLSESLGMELKGTGVNVLCVSPGPTYTNFSKASLMADSKYDKSANKMMPEKVAEEAIIAMKAGKSNVITGTRNKLNIFCAKLLPRKILNVIALKRFKN